MAAAVPAQRIAVITPDDTTQSQAFARKFASSLADRSQVLDDELARSAFNSFHLETPFNLSTEESKKIASAIGCDFFVLIRSSTLRRSASDRPEYYDANAAIFLVSGRTGQLVSFDLIRRESAKPITAIGELLDLAVPAASQLLEKMKTTVKSELKEPPRPTLDEVPDPSTLSAKNFRAPVPYRRIKPDYTTEAASYDVRATVDIEVDLTAEGAITATRIVRWAGYGLDQTVDQAVRSMNWRPAERSGKTLPMRILLRYNFKRVEKE
jgi:TonB family protein